MKAPLASLAKTDTRLIDYSLQILGMQYQRLSSLYTHVSILIPVLLAIGVGGNAVLNESLIRASVCNFFAGCTLLLLIALYSSLGRAVYFLYLAGAPKSGYKAINISEINARLIDSGNYGNGTSEMTKSGMIRLQQLVDDAVESAYQSTEVRYDSLRSAIKWVLVSGAFLASAAILSHIALLTGV